MSKMEILFNYKQAVEQAEKLETLSKRLIVIVDQNLEPATNTLKAVWESDYSWQYYKKADTVKENIKKSAENLNMIAVSIRKTAKIIRDAELEAWETAVNRSY